MPTRLALGAPVDDLPLRQRIAAVLRLHPELKLLEIHAPGAAPDVTPDILVAAAPSLPAGIDQGDGPVLIVLGSGPEGAVHAFELGAADYLVPPYDDLRLSAALTRAVERVRLRRRGDPPVERFPEVLAIKLGGEYPLVKVDEIEWIQASGNYARLHFRGTSRLLSRSLTELETRVLDPERFLRVHRSTIVNLSRIESVEPLFHGELSLRLRGGARLTCSRRYRHRLRERVFFTA